MKNTLDFYKKIYNPLFKKNYTKGTHRGGVSLDVFKKFCEGSDVKVNNVLDVGCAWGKTLKYWKTRGVNAVGVDVSKISIKFCEKKGYECYLASATDLSIFKDNEFDLYMASDVYEHLRKKDLSHAIKEAKRVTKKYLLIRVYPLIDRRGKIDKKKALHLTVWSISKWSKFFKKHGLKIVPIGKGGKLTYNWVFLMVAE